MIPRLHRRGRSFKGSCAYVLHDPKADTNDRVAWVMTRNLHSDPADAWFEMHETARNQARLKENAGLSARGRKNTTPVLHYTLSWHIDDRPDEARMREAALASLKALGLEGHEALIVAHDDKQHPHVHVVANTVHPYTGRTADLKFSKERLSRWAEAWEREHGPVRCEARVRNNELRREARERRLKEQQAANPARDRAPYIAVKDGSPARPLWFAKKEITDRIKRLRAELELVHKVERGATGQVHKTERDALDRNTRAAIDHARAHVADRFRSSWRTLYKEQKQEQRFVARSATHPLERAVFVLRNRHRLGNGKPLTPRQMAGLILSGRRLARALEKVHERERRALAHDQKAQLRQLTDRIWTIHRGKFQALRDRQAQERTAGRADQRAARKEIDFARAKAHLIDEIENPPPPRPVPKPVREQAEPAQEFNQAAEGRPSPEQQAESRAEQIRREMEEWRRRNKGRDHGRDM